MPNNSIQYKPLGTKTWFQLFLRRLDWAMYFFVVLCFAVFVLFKFSLVDTQVIINVISGGIAIWVIMLFATFLLSWLEYTHYSITLNPQDIEVSRGVLNQEVLGIPYRRIRSLNIIRGINDQMFGVSNIEMGVMGEDEGGINTTMVFPALAKETAIAIQNIVLQRSEIEEVKPVK